MSLPAFAATAGAASPRILFVAESWGESEEQVRKPLIGESGKELWRMLGEAMPDLFPEAHAKAQELHKYGALTWVKEREHWMEQASIAYTNVLALRPPGNKIEALCGTKKEMPKDYDWPHIAQGKYLRPEYLAELDRLDEEIEKFSPNIIVALGNTASWALCRETNIGSIRGTIRQSRLIRNKTYKVLPTYHPAGVLRSWAWRPLVVSDLMKAFRESATPVISRPSRTILYAPSLEEIESWIDSQVFGASPPRLIACDTETSRGQVTMIGFATERNSAMLIPLVRYRPDPASGWNWWPEAWMEEKARELANRVLSSGIPKVFQNGMYDFQYLLREHFNLTNCTEDTMLLHHSVLPEMRKGLGFLGSIYTNEPPWKLMAKVKMDTEKRDE